MGFYRVVLEIELDAKNPLNAAKETEEMIRDGHFQYYVQNQRSKKIFSVDLDEMDKDAVLPVPEYKPLIVQP
jgi:hypothetical protein